MVNLTGKPGKALLAADKPGMFCTLLVGPATPSAGVLLAGGAGKRGLLITGKMELTAGTGLILLAKGPKPGLTPSAGVPNFWKTPGLESTPKAGLGSFGKPVKATACNCLGCEIFDC